MIWLLRHDAAAIWAVGAMGEVEMGGDGWIDGETGDGSWMFRTAGWKRGCSARGIDSVVDEGSPLGVDFARKTSGMSSGCQISQRDLTA